MLWYRGREVGGPVWGLVRTGQQPVAKQRRQRRPPPSGPEANAAIPVFLSSDGAGCRVRVHVVPRANATELAGIHGDRLRVRVTAPPVDGAANTACAQLLAAQLGVSRADVTLVRGARSRDKDFGVRGVSLETVAAALAREQ